MTLNEIAMTVPGSTPSNKFLQCTLEESGDERRLDSRSDNERNSDSEIDKDDSDSLIYGVESADPVCVQLNDLIHREVSYIL